MVIVQVNIMVAIVSVISGSCYYDNAHLYSPRSICIDYKSIYSKQNNTQTPCV